MVVNTTWFRMVLVGVVLLLSAAYSTQLGCLLSSSEGSQLEDLEFTVWKFDLANHFLIFMKRYLIDKSSCKACILTSYN